MENSCSASGYRPLADRECPRLSRPVAKFARRLPKLPGVPDEMLNEFSATGDFILIDASAREKLLKEIRYQNDGMVDPRQAKSIGKAAGADLLIFGAVRMKPKSRDGKTIKDYSINIRMTDLERGIEVLRTRVKVHKFSDQSSTGW